MGAKSRKDGGHGGGMRSTTRPLIMLALVVGCGAYRA